MESDLQAVKTPAIRQKSTPLASWQSGILTSLMLLPNVCRIDIPEKIHHYAELWYRGNT